MPSHVIDYAIKEASETFSKCMNQFKKSNKRFKLHFKSKVKSTSETIQLDKCYFSKNNNTIFPSFLGKHIKSSQQFQHLKKKNSSLTYHRKLKTWKLNINYEAEKKSCVNTTEIKDVALDPGEKIFMASYSPKSIFHFGIDASDKLYNKAKEVDIIQSKMAKSNKKSFKRAFHNKLKKIKHMRDELHWKTINFLTKTYNRIVLPEFNTKGMVRTLTHSVARKVNTLSFFLFKQRLIHKCNERNVKLVIGTEEYTTKTCTRCGTIHSVSGRIYKCKKCKLEINRDINGARNIYLKYL
jgi:putative transposase